MTICTSIINDNHNEEKVFVSGCYDLLHSGHVEFFQQASQYGDLYVGSGVIDFLPTLDKVKPDVFVVNAEGGSGDARPTGILL